MLANFSGEQGGRAEPIFQMTGRDDIGEFSIATSFGGGRRIYHDKKWTRPTNVAEMLRQIEATRLGNAWDWAEFARNCRVIGLPTVEPSKFTAADLRAFSPAQLKAILDDFEKYRMILYED